MDDVLYWDSVFFGSDDCELCGYNYDELSVDITIMDDKPQFTVTFSVGCYGGTSYSGENLAEAVELIDHITSSYGIFTSSEEPFNDNIALSGPRAVEEVLHLKYKFMEEANKWMRH